MRETLDIRNFDKGLVTNYDASDINLDAGLTFDNIDLNIDGKMVALPAATAKNLAPAVEVSDWIPQTDGSYDLIWANTSTLYVTQNFYTSWSPSSLGSYTVKSIQALNRGAYIGTTSGKPIWSGKIEFGQFKGSAPSGYQTEEIDPLAHVAKISATLTPQNESTPADAGDYFQSGTYFYKASVIYDGIEESPLGATLSATNVDIPLSSSYESVLIALTVNPTGFSKRISGINIYRAYTDIYEGAEPKELYRLVTTIDINDTNWSGYTISITDTGREGVTYEQNTGISETLDQDYINFQLSCIHNSELVIAKCSTNLIPDAQYCIFKSQQGRFGMYNWTENLIRMPEIPTAMASYGGKIYVFTTNNMYRINGQGFYVEDELKGIGCVSQKSIVSTEYGLFWADANNVYRIKEFQIDTIGLAVQNLYKTSVTNPVLGFDSRYLTLIIGQDSRTVPECIIFHVIKDKWGRIGTIAGDGGIYSFIIGKDGIAYVSCTTYLYDPFGGAYAGIKSYRNPIYVSPKIDCGDALQDKIFYYIKVDSNRTTNNVYKFLYDIYTTKSMYTNEESPTVSNTGNMVWDSGWVKRNSIYFQISETWTGSYPTTPLEINSIQIIFRRLYGKR